MAVQVPAIVSFLVWVYRANRNARALGAAWMQYSPASSVVCFFIPILGLITPYCVVREIERASRPGDGGQPQAPASMLLRVWWAAFVLSIVIQFSRIRFLFAGGWMGMLTRWPYAEGGHVTAFGTSWLGSVRRWSRGCLAHDVAMMAASVLTAGLVLFITGRQATG